jgi:hypothetical protein
MNNFQVLSSNLEEMMLPNLRHFNMKLRKCNLYDLTLRPEGKEIILETEIRFGGMRVLKLYSHKD